MPRAIVHGPKQYVGLEFPHLYTEQLLVKLTIILQYATNIIVTMGILVTANAELFY